MRPAQLGLRARRVTGGPPRRAAGAARSTAVRVVAEPAHHAVVAVVGAGRPARAPARAAAAPGRPRAFQHAAAGRGVEPPQPPRHAGRERRQLGRVEERPQGRAVERAAPPPAMRSRNSTASVSRTGGSSGSGATTVSHRQAKIDASRGVRTFTGAGGAPAPRRARPPRRAARAAAAGLDRPRDAAVERDQLDLVGHHGPEQLGVVEVEPPDRVQDQDETPRCPTPPRARS